MLSRRSVLLGLFACTLLSVAMGAQASKPCAIIGIVLDASNSPLAGVSVEVVNNSGDQPYSISTDTDGKFQLSGLPSGTYTMTVSFPEYQTFKREGIALAPGVNSSNVVRLRPNGTRN